MSKPARYWPGKAPAAPIESSSDESESEAEVQQNSPRLLQKNEPSSDHYKPKTYENKPQTKQALSSQENQKSGKESKPHSIDETDDQEEIELENRRNRMRERALAFRHEEDLVALGQNQQPQTVRIVSVENKAKSESSDYSSDSESEEEEAPRVMIKPVFRKKDNRETIIEKKKVEIDAQIAQVKRVERLEERKIESVEMVMDALRKEMAELEEITMTFDIDDTDDINYEEEEAAWKLRELERLTRDATAKQKRTTDAEEIERRRKMTDVEVEEENERLGKNRSEDRPKYRFLQKYYHKGAFATGDEKMEQAIGNTDGNAPTLEDHFDKSFLPSVMQVKNFGLKGRTKYTHLTDQDTTKFGNEATWSAKGNINKSLNAKAGGMRQGFTKPISKKRKTDEQ